MFYIHIVLCFVAQYTFSRKLVACSHNTIAKFPLILGVGNRYVKYLEKNTVNHMFFKVPTHWQMSQEKNVIKKIETFYVGSESKKNISEI
jgi:hypothetical protein